MNVEQAQRANELFIELHDALDMQSEILGGLKEAIEEYQEFLSNQLKELR